MATECMSVDTHAIPTHIRFPNASNSQMQTFRPEGLRSDPHPLGKERMILHFSFFPGRCHRRYQENIKDHPVFSVARESFSRLSGPVGPNSRKVRRAGIPHEPYDRGAAKRPRPSREMQNNAKEMQVNAKVKQYKSLQVQTKQLKSKC